MNKREKLDNKVFNIECLDSKKDGNFSKQSTGCFPTVETFC